MNSYISSFKSRIPLAALLAVITLIALEVVYLKTTFGFTGIPIFEPTVDDAVVVARQKAIAESLHGVDTVIVGDSSSLRGVMPAVLEGSEEMKFYNLGTFVSFSLAGQLELAAQAIQSSETIQTVVVSILPISLTITENKAREYDLLGRFLISNPSALDVFQPSFRDYISWFQKKHRINKLPAYMGGSFDNLFKALEASGGYLAKKSIPIRTDRLFGPIEVSEFTLNTLSSFMRVTREADVQVVLSFNPRPSSVVTPDYQESTSSALQIVSEQFPEIILGQSLAPVWENQYFSDASHLNEAGARRNSDELRQRHFQ